PLDPVRFIGNRSSGKQGHAIAAALADAGAAVTLVTGPVSIPDPSGVHTVHVETASQMLTACETALPCDIAICAAAVSDWSAEASGQKIKKRDDGTPPSLKLTENPDILATISKHTKRPQLVIGFAAETNDLLNAAKAKLQRKNCDFILANDVSSDKNVFGSDENHVYLIGSGHEEDWQQSSKKEVACKLVDFVTRHLADKANQPIAAE
ncbi:MAG: phosphopantothenoylcysteine decarboxylase, partial [Pseudomonadota bacterium]|nr:phosphopantothenoylcysteine decarboxylase [Pseudomonadota bacterium]